MQQSRNSASLGGVTELVDVVVTADKEGRGRRDIEWRRKWVGWWGKAASTQTQRVWCRQSWCSWRRREETQTTKVCRTLPCTCLYSAARARYCQCDKCDTNGRALRTDGSTALLCRPFRRTSLLV